MDEVVDAIFDALMTLLMFASLILPVCATLIAIIQSWYFTIPSIIVFVVTFRYNIRKHKEKQGAIK